MTSIDPSDQTHSTSTETVGNITFTYTDKSLTRIKANHWFDVYMDCVLETGEQVGQISVEYNFSKKSESGSEPVFAVYLETRDGGVHHTSLNTVSHFNDVYNQ
jgi:hypothetical protein